MDIVDKGKGNKIEAIADLKKGEIEIRGNHNELKLSKDLKNISLLIEGNYNTIEIQENVTIFKKLRINITGNHCRIKIGKDTSIYELKILVNEDSNKVEIGEDCMISEAVRILASDSHSIFLVDDNTCINYHRTGVKIGNHVWLGMNALLLKDTQIGDNVIVAAGAVVTNKENKSNIVLGGNPAKIIKKGVNWERKIPQKTEQRKIEKLEGENAEGNIVVFVEKNEINEKKIRKISGWAYVEGMDSNDSEIYLKIIEQGKSEIYKTQMNERKDIASIYGEQYGNCGFDISFFQNKKMKKVSILIKNKDQIYEKELMEFHKNEEKKI